MREIFHSFLVLPDSHRNYNSKNKYIFTGDSKREEINFSVSFYMRREMPNMKLIIDNDLGKEVAILVNEKRMREVMKLCLMDQDFRMVYIFIYSC